MNSPRKLKKIKLLGGPLTGREVLVDRGMETLRIGQFWTYRYAGKLGKQECFSIVPRQRWKRRAELAYIIQYAMHPRVAKLQEAK